MNKSTDITSNFSSFLLGEEDKLESPYGVPDWQNLIKDLAAEPIKPSRSPSVERYFSNLWPVSEPQVTNFNSAFLLDLPYLVNKANPKDWLIRDGLIPLIWFYAKNPFPGSLKDTLIIHSEFEEIVPEAWRGQTKLFEHIQERPDHFVPPGSSEVKELLLTGLVMASVCSLDRLETDLKKLLIFLGDKEGLERVKIRACLPIRIEDMGRVQGQNFYNRYHQILNQYLGTNIEFIEYDALKWMPSSWGTWTHEFNERLLYTDSHFSSLPLTKGYRLVPLNEEPPLAPDIRHFEKIIPLYPHLSCGIRSTFRKPAIIYHGGNWVPESPERARFFFNAVNSTANRIYPWPDLFTSWCPEAKTDAKPEEKSKEHQKPGVSEVEL